MNIDIRKPFFILFGKSSLLNLLIFFLIGVLNTYSLYFPNWDNGIGVIILSLITIILLLGYVIETVHIATLNNDKGVKLPNWNANILKYSKHSLLIILILIIYQSILLLISFITPLTLKNLNALTLSIVFPLIIIVYSKNYKIQEALNYKIYLNLIISNFLKIIVFCVLITVFYVGVYLIFDISKVLFMHESRHFFYDYFVYLFGGFAFISYFVFILFYSQICSEKQEDCKG